MFNLLKEFIFIIQHIEESGVRGSYKGDFKIWFENDANSKQKKFEEIILLVHATQWTRLSQMSPQLLSTMKT